MRIAVLLSLVLALELVKADVALSTSPLATDAGTVSNISSVARIGSRLYDTGPNGYAFAFEVTSILILVSMLGAVIIARRPRKEER